MVNYDEFMPFSVSERIKIFNEVSAENRALLVKTQVERWREDNLSGLNQEQIDALDELIKEISPDWYKEDRETEKVQAQAETLVKKLELHFPREDLRQIATLHADYISPNEKG